MELVELSMFKHLSGIFLLFLFVSCGKEEYSVTNINGGHIDILGHGGMGYYSSYPMNSFESLALAINSGADGTEMDVQLTADSVLITFHDEFIDEKTNGTGRVIDHDLIGLDNIHFDESPFNSFEISSLDKVLTEASKQSDFRLTFDCKVYPSSPGELDNYTTIFSEQLKSVFDEYELHDKVIVEASNLELIDKLKNLDSSIRVLYYPESFDKGFEIANERELFGITISMHKITKEQVQQAHDAGLFVTIWQARTRKNNRDAIRLNPDMIQSDRLKHLINELR